MEERSVTTDWTKTKVSPEVTLIWPRSPVSVSRLKVSLMAGCQEARAGPATVPRRHRSPSMAVTRLDLTWSPRCCTYTCTVAEVNQCHLSHFNIR